MPLSILPGTGQPLNSYTTPMSTARRQRILETAQTHMLCNVHIAGFQLGTILPSRGRVETFQVIATGRALLAGSG